jgi:hypothetical protein
MDHYVSAHYDPETTGSLSWHSAELAVTLLIHAVLSLPRLCPAQPCPFWLQCLRVSRQSGWLFPPLPPRCHSAVLPWSHLHGPLPQSTLVKHLQEAQQHM